MWYIKIIMRVLLLALVWEVSLAGVYEDMLDAVKKDDVRAVSQLLKRGVDAATVDREGNSLLILAIKEGSVGTVKALLAARADVNSRNALGETALMLAALRGIWKWSGSCWFRARRSIRGGLDAPDIRCRQRQCRDQPFAAGLRSPNQRHCR